MSYPRFQRSRDFKFFNRTAGNLTLNSTTWANLPTIGTTWDITLAAETGDTVQVGLSALWGSEAVFGFLDVSTIVSAVAVNALSGAGGVGGEGMAGWRGAASTAFPIGASPMYTLLVGDISSGTVTLRLRYRTFTAAAKTLYAATDDPLHFWAKNLGPMDPN